MTTIGAGIPGEDEGSNVVPPALSPVEVDDVALLTAAFDELSSPLTATLQGAAAARHDEESFAVAHAAEGLFTVLAELGHKTGRPAL